MVLTSRSLGAGEVLSSLAARPQNGGLGNRGVALLSSLAAPARAQLTAMAESAQSGTLRLPASGPPISGASESGTASSPEAAQFASPETAPRSLPGAITNVFAPNEGSVDEGEEEEETAEVTPTKAPPSAEKLAFLATLQRAKEGDLKAFEEIYQLYHRRIYNAVYGMLGDPDDAQDVTQDVFMRLHDALPTLRADEAFSTYLYRIALNLCRDRARRKKRVRFQSMDTPRADDDGDVEPMEFPDAGKLPEELLTTDELQARVREAVLTLSTDHKAVIVMHHFQGMEVNDIAGILKVPTGTVKSRLARGRDQLNRKLRSYLNF
ncbi:RNA polymerase sigma factor, sigma-70 family [Abditibacterium utsteinense]|uniref:RNA polymerase sigma factor, sigma-70 family n=1 Tax=Abditibacterium utsteinense TaxID=1960156 RepID=A0A2S8SR24_9BACT|nr:sigma-70 family RNA polymerase sigma factor [Abditibacterium utsteinense]PQV63199.1 RNA polymerase sigma factor, sigma-70 family [Abditibacterium utsteinense]